MENSRSGSGGSINNTVDDWEELADLMNSQFPNILQSEYENLEKETSETIQRIQFLEKQIKELQIKSEENWDINEEVEVEDEEKEEEPLLLINVSKWSNNRFIVSEESRDWIPIIDENDDLQTYFETNLQDLFLPSTLFEQKLEPLFDSRTFFHTTSRKWKKHIQILENRSRREYTNKNGENINVYDYFTTVQYPSTLRGLPTQKVWKETIKESNFEVINTIKKELLKTSKSLSWKNEISFHLENMATEQALLGKTLSMRMLKQEQDRILLQINHKDLQNRLNNQLQALLSPPLPTTTNSSTSNQVISIFPDDELTDEEEMDQKYQDWNEDSEGNSAETYFPHHEHPDDHLFFEQNEEEMNEKEKILMENMNILDKILCMIFSSKAYELSSESLQQNTFSQNLLKKQISIRKSWENELGCLPPSSLWN